jgi:Transposase IS4
MLPHISRILRKPKDLGTEFKVTADSVQGCLLYLETQKGKMPMRQMKHYDDLGSTAACTLRMVEGTEGIGRDQWPSASNLFFADSWFAGVKLVEKLIEKGHAFIGPVKTNTSGFPGTEISAIMKDWPAGSSIVFDAKDGQGNKLGMKAVGYKYHKKSSIHFIMTSDAGGTKNGST